MCINLFVRVCQDVSTRLFSWRLRLFMSLQTTKLKVPLLMLEGNRSEFDSLTVLISVLDTNSGTDAPGQSVVSLELHFNGHLTGGFVALCLTVDRVAKQTLIFSRLLGFPRTIHISWV